MSLDSTFTTKRPGSVLACRIYWPFLRFVDLIEIEINFTFQIQSYFTKVTTANRDDTIDYLFFMMERFVNQCKG